MIKFTIENCKLWLPKLKKPMFIGSVSLRVMAKFMAAAEFSLTNPNTFNPAIPAALIKAILALHPQLAGTAKTQSLI